MCGIVLLGFFYLAIASLSTFDITYRVYANRGIEYLSAGLGLIALAAFILLLSRKTRSSIDQSIDKAKLLPKCQDCRRTDDLAQCSECHLWFCREHDTHECISQPQTPELRGRIARVKAKRNVGVAIMVLAIFFDMIILGIWDYFLSSNPSTLEAFFEAVIINVSFLALGYVIKRHYSTQLQKLGVLSRSIRPQIAQKDR